MTKRLPLWELKPRNALSDEDALLVRQLYFYPDTVTLTQYSKTDRYWSQHQLSKTFGVARATILHAIHGTGTYSHLKDDE